MTKLGNGPRKIKTMKTLVRLPQELVNNVNNSSYKQATKFVYWELSLKKPTKTPKKVACIKCHKNE